MTLFAYLVIMGFYLVMAAIYDRHGTMVPDYVTFPYALLGLFVGALQGRFLTVVVGTVLFIMVLSDIARTGNAAEPLAHQAGI